jgi:hypothetical protein
MSAVPPCRIHFLLVHNEDEVFGQLAVLLPVRATSVPHALVRVICLPPVPPCRIHFLLVRNEDEVFGQLAVLLFTPHSL